MNIRELLIKQYGYSPKNVDIMVKRLEALEGTFQIALTKWVQTGEDVSPGEYYGYTIDRLMNENQMNYPAALTTLNWIAENGEAAVKEIKKGVK